MKIEMSKVESFLNDLPSGKKGKITKRRLLDLWGSFKKNNEVIK